MAQAQNPVQWKYSVVKVDNATYELHLTATMQEGWHIYAQQQPKEAIAVPTQIAYRANPLVTPVGTAREIGQKETQTVEALDIKQYQYAHTVDFVQKITLKATVKTSFSGTVTFQACTDKQCLPPKVESFDLTL
ncbi:MAG: hypothetical protein BGO55_08630 [Sphingobacteriales bacterium 50-39]|nr:MAG: hypothetical protein BGO55_08630 [Sphingobacteriales bacterium 50-39]